MSLLRISRDREAASRSPAARGRRTARSRRATGARPRRSTGTRPSVFYFWKGERPRHPNAPQLEGTGEIKVESADRATGYWTTRSDRDATLNARTAGIYVRADAADLDVLDGGSEEERPSSSRSAWPSGSPWRTRSEQADSRRGPDGREPLETRCRPERLHVVVDTSNAGTPSGSATHGSFDRVKMWTSGSMLDGSSSVPPRT